MSNEQGVMSSEEADHVSPGEVTPTLGKGTLGTWRAHRQQLWSPSGHRTGHKPLPRGGSRLWANHGVRVNANQRLSLGEEGKAYGGKPRLQTGPGEIPPSGIIGASENVTLVEMCSHLATERV